MRELVVFTCLPRYCEKCGKEAITSEETGLVVLDEEGEVAGFVDGDTFAECVNGHRWRAEVIED